MRDLWTNQYTWMLKTLPETYGQLLSKFERRSEMILAAEPTLQCRLRGYLNALKAWG